MTDAPDKRAPMSLADQAHMIGRLVEHCTMHDGRIADTMHRFTVEDVEELAALRDRLDWMAPFEAKIRRLVTGR